MELWVQILQERHRLSQIIIDDSGTDYLVTSDGSQGGDGRTWAEVDETTVRRADGTYDTPYSQEL